MFWPTRLTYSAIDRVVDDFGLALDFLRQLLAQRDLLLERIEVDAAGNVALADRIGVFFLVVGHTRPEPTGSER